MIGIYRIINMITGQSYIGQSSNIMERLSEHFFHRSSTNASYIDSDIGYYGIHNFVFQILEICRYDELDWKEDYYIHYFMSNVYGYNIINGGTHNIGDSNPNSKITSEDVYNIRNLYNAKLDPNFVFDKYFKGKISITTFFSIWEGKSWTNIHMDVYTDENISYYKNLINSKDYTKDRTNFTDDEIMRFRTRFVNETAEEIYNSEKLSCKFATFKSILTGESYKHLPVYLKKKKFGLKNN